MLKFPGLVLALACLSGPAFAQSAFPAENPDAPVTAQQKAQASAFADAVIARARAGDVFDNVTTGANAAIKHKASGIQCRFVPGDAAAELKVTSRLKGRHVFSCTHTSLGYRELLSFQQHPGKPDLNELFGQAERATVASRPGAAPYKGAVTTISPRTSAPAKMKELLPEPKRSYVIFKQKGVAPGEADMDVIQRTAVLVFGDWSVTQLVAGPADEISSISLYGEVTTSYLSLDFLMAAIANAKPG